MKEVEYYLENILKKSLLDMKISSDAVILESVIENVKEQMISLLYHWQDEDFRNTILLVGNEEGTFYEPKAPLMIKSFVVVTIRNSMIETAGSKSFYRSGFVNPIDDMKVITSQAIQYFSKLDFNELSGKIPKPSYDYYQDVIEKYPNSFHMFHMLMKMKAKELRFEKLTITKCSNLSLNYIAPFSGTRKVIEDAYEIEPSIRLKQSLQAVVNYKIPFFVDSFKVASRNFEKLYRIIQFLLENDCAFVTSNYYISNGYLAKRQKLLRPCHDPNHNLVNLRNETGISEKHKQELKRQRQQ